MNVDACKALFARWFYPRKLLIVSDHKVKQVSIGVKFQVCMVTMLASGALWAMIATGMFITASTTIEEQNSALESITSAKTNAMMSALLPTSSFAKDPLEGTTVKFSSLKDPTLARIAVLQQQVSDLKNTNEMIVERVREKTGDDMAHIKSVIAETGLDPEDLRKQAKKTQPWTKAEGGPLIPAHLTNLPNGTEAMFSGLDELAMMRKIMGNLPLASPIQNADEQSGFGNRIDPFSRHLAFHAGLDLAAPVGAPVFSTADGVVSSAGRDGAYGNKIDIEHGFGVSTRYGHLSRIFVSEGQHIKKGDKIGIQGETGRATGPHLHYEVRNDDKPMNPKKFLEAGRDISKN